MTQLDALLRAVPDDDPSALRTTFAQFPTGVVALSAQVESAVGAEPVVLIASSFQVGISLEPPLVLFAVQHSSTSWPRLRTQRRIGVSLLGEMHGDAVRQLASKAADRFAGIATTSVLSGAHFIDRAPVWLECSVYSEMPAGDHDVVLLRVHASARAEGVGPLVWHGAGFRTLEPVGDLSAPDSRAAKRSWVGPWSALGREALTTPDPESGLEPVDLV